MSDQANDPEFEAWVRDQVIDPMTDSALVTPIWSGKVDWKIALEMGAAMLLDKPILVLCAPGTLVPRKLSLVADRIIDVDLLHDEGREAAHRAIAEFIDGLP